MSIIIRIVEAVAGAFGIFYYLGSIAEKDNKTKEIYGALSFAFLLMIVLIEFIYMIKL